MVKMVRIALMFLAALLFAGGPIAYADWPAPEHIHLSHQELAMHVGHAPMNAYGMEKQCSKAGCALASCPLQMAALAIVPEYQAFGPALLSLVFAMPDDASLSSLHTGPPSPPPKSPLLVTRAA
jgi:hypothetical protein